MTQRNKETKKQQQKVKRPTGQKKQRWVDG